MSVRKRHFRFVASATWIFRATGHPRFSTNKALQEATHWSISTNHKITPPKERHKSSDLPTCCTAQTTQSLGLRLLRIFANQKKTNISTNLRVSLYGFTTPKRWNLKGSTQAGANCYPGRKPIHKSLGDFRWKIIETQILGAEDWALGICINRSPGGEGFFRDGFYPLVN